MRAHNSASLAFPSCPAQISGVISDEQDIRVEMSIHAIHVV